MKATYTLLLILISCVLHSQPIGTLTCDLKAKNAYIGQSAYMDFYHGLAMSREGVDISLSGLLSIDGVISSGLIYDSDIKRLYPFDNTMTVLRMTGAEIRRYLEASYESWVGKPDDPDGLLLTKVTQKADGSQKWNFKNSPANFDSAAGIDYTVNVNLAPGERVCILSMADGTQFDEDAVYNVAINSYRATGAGKLLQAAGINPKAMEDRIVSQGMPFRQILRDYIASHNGEIDPLSMRCGNWSFVPEGTSEIIAKDLSRVFGMPERPLYNTKEEIANDIERCGAVYYLYPMDQPEVAKAPKGYKPFYISHLGRHGSRFALGNSLYSDIRELLEMAGKKGWLTEAGENYSRQYMAFYPFVAGREGNLTRKGQQQHRAIARRMYSDYPEVFKGHTKAIAVSTNSHRVVASMYNFLAELDSLDRDFVYDTDYGWPYQALLSPEVAPEMAEMSGTAQKKLQKFTQDRLDMDEILGRLFTEPDSLGGDKYKICYKFHTLVSSLDNLDFDAPAGLNGLFTDNERYRLWEVYNYGGYLRYGMSPDVGNVRVEAMRPLLAEIINTADEDIAGGIALRLRFAHDTTILPLITLMDLNNMGVSITDPYELENYWRTYDIPMAANLQLVFFAKGKDKSDILVKVLLNGREATLPLEMAAPGSFYRWDDIKALYAASVNPEDYSTKHKL